MSSSTWNYRVLKVSDGFEIHSVHYDNTGKPAAVGVTAAYPSGETLDELKRDLTRFSEALSKPTLEMSDFEKEYPEDEPSVTACDSWEDLE